MNFSTSFAPGNVPAGATAVVRADAFAMFADWLEKVGAPGVGERSISGATGALVSGALLRCCAAPDACGRSDVGEGCGVIAESTPTATPQIAAPITPTPIIPAKPF